VLQSIRLYFFAKTTQIVSDHFRFQFFKKWANLRLAVNVKKIKSALALGGLCPCLPNQGLCP